MKSIAKSLLVGLLFVSSMFIISCSDDEMTDIVPFGVAFETTAIGIQNGANSVIVRVTFTNTTTVANQIRIGLTESGVVYGDDYVTTPAAVSGMLTLDVPVGTSAYSFEVERIGDAIVEGSSVNFSLESVTGEEETVISGNTSIDVSFSAVASAGASLVAEIGGAAQPNQVFVDFSLNTQTTAERVSWDLGLSNGSADQVILNFSTYSMAYELEANDISAVTAADTAGLAGTVVIGTAGAHIYIDHPDGDMDKLAIANVSETDDDNKVYIINRGAGPGTGDVTPGSVDVGSVPRGWKKVRILKRGDSYLIQHADIASTEFSETIISRSSGYNFSYFSFESTSAVAVEPVAADWDIVFSVSSNIINFGRGDGAYGFSDFVKSNRQGGVMVARIALDTEEDGTIIPGQTTYDDFTADDLDGVTFSEAANTIGSSWRSVFTRTANSNVYFIIEDAEGNRYKLQFLGLLNELGERGNSSFRYELL